ncbi:MAG: hypothetical protein ACI8WY_000531, partial [Planctomycetota bacterium]
MRRSGHVALALSLGLGGWLGWGILVAPGDAGAPGTAHTLDL